MSIKRQLPVVPKTGDQQTKAWFSAASEIIKALIINLDAANKTKLITNTTGAEVMPVDISGKEDTSNKSFSLVNANNKTYPSTLAVQNALTAIVNNELFVDEWNVATETVIDIDAQAGDVYRITGAGTYAGKTLNVDDYVKFYINSASALDVIITGNVALQVSNTTTISAGDGLVGGGTLAADRTISMGAPSKISQSTVNSVSGDTHTHEMEIDNPVPDPPSSGTYALQSIDGVLTWVIV